MNTAEITTRLGLHSLKQRAWYIQASCATTGDGLYEGLMSIDDEKLKISYVFFSNKLLAMDCSEYKK